MSWLDWVPFSATTETKIAPIKDEGKYNTLQEMSAGEEKRKSLN